jgi:uncharacterized membrane protein
MREWLVFFTEHAITLIDTIALVVVVYATLEAFVSGLRIVLKGPDEHERRHIWLRYARWLVAALTFQLAADIVETSITTDWAAIGRIGAIAVIRTFLNFFLDRDYGEVRERQHPQASRTES